MWVDSEDLMVSTGAQRQPHVIFFFLSFEIGSQVARAGLELLILQDPPHNLSPYPNATLYFETFLWSSTPTVNIMRHRKSCGSCYGALLMYIPSWAYDWPERGLRGCHLGDTPSWEPWQAVGTLRDRQASRF